MCIDVYRCVYVCVRVCLDVLLRATKPLGSCACVRVSCSSDVIADTEKEPRHSNAVLGSRNISLL